MEFNLSFDAACTSENILCRRGFCIDKGIDALEENWGQLAPGNFFMNPPYGRKIIDKFVLKAYESSRDVLVVCLLPARTDTKWWSIFWDYELHKPKPGIEVRFLKGRLKFGNAESSAPFPSAVIIMDRRTKP